MIHLTNQIKSNQEKDLVKNRIKLNNKMINNKSMRNKIMRNHKKNKVNNIQMSKNYLKIWDLALLTLQSIKIIAKVHVSQYSKIARKEGNIVNT